MTRQQLLAIMNAPTDDDGTTLLWSALEYHFTAVLDVKGNVRQLDIKTHDLTAAEKSAVECAFTRTER